MRSIFSEPHPYYHQRKYKPAYIGDHFSENRDPPLESMSIGRNILSELQSRCENKQFIRSGLNKGFSVGFKGEQLGADASDLRSANAQLEK